MGAMPAHGDDLDPQEGVLELLTATDPITTANHTIITNTTIPNTTTPAD